MTKVFIDDSANSSNEPYMWMAGWVGRVPTWDAFADDWEKTLAANNPKPIDYFKHSEARSGKGCFAKFTTSETNDKLLNLAGMITNHDVYGAAFFIDRAAFYEMVDRYAENPPWHNLRDPAFLCILNLMAYVMGVEHRQHRNDKVDFIFDGRPKDTQAKRIIAMFEKVKEVVPEPMASLMGSAIPMDDMEVLPLQAADLLAGQSRLVLLQNDGSIPEPLQLLSKRLDVHVRTMWKETLYAVIQQHNIDMRERRPLVIEVERKRQRGDK